MTSLCVLKLLSEHRSGFIEEISKRISEEVIEAILGARDDVHFKLEAADEDIFRLDIYDGDSLIRLCERSSAAA